MSTFPSPRACLVSPPEASECPLCGCRTVQLLKDGSSYCSRVACRYESEDAEKEKAARAADMKVE